MGDVWDRTVEFLSDHLGAILPVAIFAILIPTSVTGALQPLQASGELSTRTVLSVVALGFAVLELWAQLAITALAIDPAMGRRATRIANAGLLETIAIYALLFAVLVVLSLPIVGVLAGMGVDLTADRIDLTVVGPALLGVIAIYGLIVTLAVIFVGARLVPLLPVIVAEKRGVGAITHTFRLTRGLSFKLIGVLILYAAVATVASLAAKTVFGSILNLVAGGEGAVTIASSITAVIVAAVSTGFTVLATAFIGKLYVAIMRQREATVPATLGSTDVS